MHLSVITIGEVWASIAGLPPGRKRRCLEGMLDLIPDRFHSRIAPVDCGITVRFGEIQAESGPLPSLDRPIATTAITRRLTLVAHNIKDMVRTGAALLDLWVT